MILKGNILSRRVVFTITKIAKVIGVNSEVSVGRHILMFDFDDKDIEAVISYLKPIQDYFRLSDIYIMETKANTNYIAYCFTVKHWREVVSIIAATEGVDWQFIRFGVFRGRFTLRVSPKGARRIRHVKTLLSDIPPDCTPVDLKSWVKYETLSWR